ncbi:unnamed protein product [Paramecium octaurelia]|uniref:Uncharacterized protein n=1 Tax=Paramecium octaurelia TaxID=43137 RepID=A0A8S1W6K6_PAROT|nr:unnamed protein product [Paramecium octaurelia]
MSTVLKQQAKREIQRQLEARRQAQSQQSNHPYLGSFKNRQGVLSPKYVGFVSNYNSLDTFRKELVCGQYSISNDTSNKKQLVDEVFSKTNANVKRELFDIIQQQFETELYQMNTKLNLQHLVDKYNSYQQIMQKFMRNVINNIEEYKSKTEFAEQQAKEKEIQINDLTVKFEELQQMFNKSSHTDRPIKSRKGDYKKQSELYMENFRLKNEIEKIQERLQILEQLSDVQKLQQDIINIKQNAQLKINELLKENEIKEKQLQKLNLHYQNIKSQYTKLENESKAYQTVFEANKYQLDKLILENENHTNLMNRYREIANMQREDFEQRLYYYKEELAIAAKAREKLSQLQNKLDRFQIEKSKEVEPQPNQQHEKEKTGLEKFASLFSTDKTFFRLTHSSLLQDKGRIVQRTGHSIIQMESHFNSQDIQLDKFTIGYSPFVIFIEHHKKTLESEFAGLQYKRPSLQLLVIMRHILDAKWNEIQMNQQSRFPEFVYSWLMNFKVDYNHKCIKKIEYDNQRVDDQIVKFIVDFSNPVLEKNWECVSFQEFLNDFSSHDEIYFFLYARNLLFRGPQCQNHQAFYEPHHYIPLLQADFVVTHLFSQYEVSTIQQVKRVLKERAVRKIQNKNIYIIEAAFVLRILLEFYRVERRNRYKMFKIAFGSRATNISFKQFRIVLISNYPKITDLELATLYREAYSFTGTGVSIDSFYTIASENGFFTKNLKIQNLTQLPHLVEEQFAFDPSQQPFILVSEAYKRLINQQKPVKELLVEIGLEILFNEFEELDNFIETKFSSLQSSQLSFVQMTDKYMSIIRNVNHLLNCRLYIQDIIPQGSTFQKLHDEKQKQQLQQNRDAVIISSENFNRQYVKKDDFTHEVELIKSQLDCLQHLANYFDSKDLTRKKVEMGQQIAAKKIQKFVRKKMNKFYSFISSLLSAKFKSSVKIK